MGEVDGAALYLVDRNDPAGARASIERGLEAIPGDPKLQEILNAMPR